MSDDGADFGPADIEAFVEAVASGESGALAAFDRLRAAAEAGDPDAVELLDRVIGAAEELGRAPERESQQLGLGLDADAIDSLASADQQLHVETEQVATTSYSALADLLFRVEKGRGPSDTLAEMARRLVPESDFALIAAAPRRPSVAGEPVEGNPVEAQLQLQARIGELPVAAEPEFAVSVLAPTLDRLEAQGATDEEIGDTAVGPLRGFGDVPLAAAVARHVAVYLEAGQDPSVERDLGYLQTLFNLALLVAGDERLWRDEAEVYIRLVDALAPVVGHTGETSATHLRVLHLSAHNLLGTLATEVQRVHGPEGAGSGAFAPLAPLRVIAAVTAEPLDIGDEIATDVLERLGLGPSMQRLDLDADVVAAVASSVGGVAAVLTDDYRAQAWLESTASVLAAAGEDPERAAGRFFNAGVSLLRESRRRDEPSAALLAARITINGCGLVTASDTHGDSLPAYVGSGAIDAAINFLGASAELRRDLPDAVDPDVEKALEEALSQVAGLASLSDLAHLGVPQLDIARLSGLVDAADVSVQGDVGPGSVGHAVVNLLGALHSGVDTGASAERRLAGWVASAFAPAELAIGRDEAVERLEAIARQRVDPGAAIGLAWGQLDGDPRVAVGLDRDPAVVARWAAPREESAGRAVRSAVDEFS